MQGHFQTQIITYAVIAIVVVLAIRRNMRGRRVRVETLWVFPAILIAMSAAILSAEPALNYPAIIGVIAAFLAGAAVGWQRGRFTRINLDPATHTLMSQASPIGLMILGVLFVIRLGLRGYVAQMRDPQLTVLMTDGLLLFAVGMISLQRVEMWIRCRKMLAEAQVQTKATPPSP